MCVTHTDFADGAFPSEFHDFIVIPHVLDIVSPLYDGEAVNSANIDTTITNALGRDISFYFSPLIAALDAGGTLIFMVRYESDPSWLSGDPVVTENHPYDNGTTTDATQCGVENFTRVSASQIDIVPDDATSNGTQTGVNVQTVGGQGDPVLMRTWIKQGVEDLITNEVTGGPGGTFSWVDPSQTPQLATDWGIEWEDSNYDIGIVALA